MRERLDLALVRRGFAASRSEAKDLIESGRVTVAGAPAFKASRQVERAEPLLVNSPPKRYVSRGAHKLVEALDLFDIDPTGMATIDVGASTGGFTDVLLQRGADSVVAVDVGTNQLHEKLSSDARVLSCEQTDIRRFDPHSVDGRWTNSGAFDLLVSDLSFISTGKLLPSLLPLVTDTGELVILVKPQFEAGRRAVSKGRGIVRGQAIWTEVLHTFLDAAVDAGADVVDLAISPILGGKGNVEFLAHLRPSSRSAHDEGSKSSSVMEEPT